MFRRLPPLPVSFSLSFSRPLPTGPAYRSCPHPAWCFKGSGSVCGVFGFEVSGVDAEEKPDMYMLRSFVMALMARESS